MSGIYSPRIITELPGPNSRKLIENDDKYVSQSYTRIFPAVLDRADGSYIWDVDGNCFVDFHAGIGVCSTGNVHPEVRAAIERQVAKGIHFASADFYHEMVGELAGRLARIAPGDDLKRVFFSNSGTEAVEAAIKLAKYATGRSRFLAYVSCFHGRTIGSLSLTCSSRVQRARFHPMMPGVTHVPYPYCYRCPINLDYPSCNLQCADMVEEVCLKQVCPGEEVAAFFTEPIQGEGGYVVPPDNYFGKIKKICEKYEILFVSDEIQAGMGRTGRWFCIEHYGVEPDVITSAKGIASGMPLGATIAQSDLMNWEPGAHSSTFGGNPVSCAAALATLGIIESELLENAERMGEYLMSQARDFQKGSEIVGDVRGKGLMIGVEIVADRATRERAPKLANEIVMECFRHGLMILTCGPNTLRLIPPLSITKETIDQGLDILFEAIRTIEKEPRK
jgi:4-aminobutyrate aminotransferase